MLPAIAPVNVLPSEPPPRRSAQREKWRQGNHDGRDDHTEVGQEPGLAPARRPWRAAGGNAPGGRLIGGAAYAGIGAATAQPAAVITTLSHGFTPDARDSFRYSRPISGIRRTPSSGVASTFDSRIGRVVRIDPATARAFHRSMRQAMGSAASVCAAHRAGQIQTPCTAEIRPLLMAASNAAWSCSFWSA